MFVSCRNCGAAALLALSSWVSGQAQDDWKGWSCDDMTPDLCDNLNVTSAVVPTLGNLSVSYFRYTPPTILPGKYPVVVVNGGPGLSHDYVSPLKALACMGREVIFYDQVGTGKSSFPPNTTAARDFPFAADILYLAHDELPLIVRDAGVEEFHLVADSFGTMVALEFALNSKESVRDGLASMILNSPIPNAKEFVTTQWDPQYGTLSSLPSYIGSRLQETQKNFESPEAQAIDDVLTTHFTYRNGIPPDCAMDSFSSMNQEVLMLLQGPSNFCPWTGSLKDFNVDQRLGALSKLPILLTSGEFDMVRPITIQRMHSNLALSETLLIPHAGHATVLDATGDLNHAIGDFMERLEKSELAGSVFVPKDHKASRQAQYTEMTKFHVVAGSLLLLSVGFLVGRYFMRERHRYETISGV